ncbi:MAG: hypothetical protein IJ317_00180 [Clostridia bacterium]|nr:hypothetical protein [Clostridia bacterium]
MRPDHRKTLNACAIYRTLKTHADKRHFSFHTPGHKNGKWDITELSYSDNLSCPRGCIFAAEQDIARILGAHTSFILTDGSTCGVLSMLHAAKRAGVKKIAVQRDTHKSFWNGCALLGLTPIVYTDEERENAIKAADAAFITSPDYYGAVAPLRTLRKLCDEHGKLLLIDGAHGGHLHFDKEIYAGAYADMWVDGVHKSLPALTQGAIVSARTEQYAELLRESVSIFRTTSPSYPIMASVEYAVKYPENKKLPALVRALAEEFPNRVAVKDDWTKVCVRVGENAFAAQAELEKRGVYPEFCDGEYICFYLSPATTARSLNVLRKSVAWLCKRFTPSEKRVQPVHAPLVLLDNGETEWVDLAQAEGRICAIDCGLFPPCTPLIAKGERVLAERVRLLQAAPNIYGIVDGKMSVYKNFNA